MATDPETFTADKPRKGLLRKGVAIFVASMVTTAGGVFTAWAIGLTPKGDPLAASFEIRGDGEVWPLVMPEDSRLRVQVDDVLNSAWAENSGGAISGGVISAYVQGTTDATVIITGFELLGVTYSPLPPEREYLQLVEGAGGDISPRYLLMNLSGDNPKVTPQISYEGVEPFDFPLTVSAAEVEVFELVMGADEPGIYDWKLGMNWTSGGQSGQYLIGGREGFHMASVPAVDSSRTWLRLEDGSWEDLAARE